jgi:hypothetical protein
MRPTRRGCGASDGAEGVGREAVGASGAAPPGLETADEPRDAGAPPLGPVVERVGLVAARARGDHGVDAACPEPVAQALGGVGRGRDAPLRQRDPLPQRHRRLEVAEVAGHHRAGDRRARARPPASTPPGAAGDLAGGCQALADAAPDAALRAPGGAGVDRGRGTLLARHIAPAAARLEHAQEAADHPALGPPRRARPAAGQGRIKRSPGPIREPHQTRHRHLPHRTHTGARTPKHLKDLYGSST